MYVSEFWLGVLSTVFVEFIALSIAAFVLPSKKDKEDDE